MNTRIHVCTSADCGSILDAFWTKMPILDLFWTKMSILDLFLAIMYRRIVCLESDEVVSQTLLTCVSSLMFDLRKRHLF
jgi:hypothetical protein